MERQRARLDRLLASFIRVLRPFPYLLIAFLLDTAIIPAFYSGMWTIPLTLALTVTVSLSSGGIPGMLYGLLGGVLSDVTSGTPGMTAIPFTLIGLVADFFLNERDEEANRMRTLRMLLIRRAICAGILYAALEMIYLIIRYFNTSRFDLVSFGKLGLRTVLFAAVVALLSALIGRRFYIPKARREKETSGPEVKHY